MPVPVTGGTSCECYRSEPSKQHHLLCATIAGHAHCVDHLLSEGHDLDLEVTARRWPYYGKTALLIASTDNYVGILRSLLNAGAMVCNSTSL